MSSPIFPQFVNFLAASRKAMLISSGYFSPNDIISFIWAPAISGQFATLQGTLDGANKVFVSPVQVGTGTILVFRNGILQDPALSYSVTGSTITFVQAPLPGDDLIAVVNQYANPPVSGPSSALQAVALSGTVDGTNAVFTVQAYNTTCIVLKNGVIQTVNVMYRVVGTTVTFLDPYIPQVGDAIWALIA
jgi:hypothetical protein